MENTEEKEGLNHLRRKVTLEEFEKHCLGEEAVQKSKELVSAAVDPDNPLTSRIDPSAPEKEKTIDCVALADKITDLVLEHYPDDELVKILTANWDQQETLRENFYRARQARNWNRQDYGEWAMAVCLAVEKPFGNRLVSNEEIEGLKQKFAKVREEILRDDSAIPRFQPKFNFFVYARDGNGHLRGEIKKVGDKELKLGNFVAVEAEEEIRLQKIVFALSLESGWQILSANQDNIEELRHIRMRIRTNDGGFYALEKLPMQTYEDAQERIRFLTSRRAEKEAEKEKYAEADAHPEIFDMEREALISETEHTFFIGTFRDLIYESLEDLIEQLAKMTPEEIAELRVILVDNRGDDGEREYFGRQRKNSGKRRGTGLPGGGTEKDTAARYLASPDFLAPKLAELAKKNELALKIFSHGFREYKNESCHALTKFHVRLGRVQKGDNHVDHFGLGSATKEQVQRCVESNEIIKTIYPTLREWYKMMLGDRELMKLYDVKEPYFIHAREFAAGLFRRYNLPMFEEMREFLKIAKR